MYQTLIPYLGVIGNILLVISYLPQIKKIIVTKKSEDLSALMWLIILLGDLCMLVYAILQNDTVFVMLFTTFIIENLVVLYLTIKFRNKAEPTSPRENMSKSTLSQKEESTQLKESKSKIDSELEPKNEKPNPPMDKSEEKDHLHPPKL